MRHDNYLLIQGWMISELGLSGGELMGYALVYGYTKDGQQWYYGGRAELAEWSSMSLKRAGECLNGLCAKGLLIREERRVNGARRCYYKAVMPSDNASPSAPTNTPDLAADAPDCSDGHVDYVDNPVDNSVDNSIEQPSEQSVAADPRDETSLGLGTKRPHPRDETSLGLGTKRPHRNIYNNNIYNTPDETDRVHSSMSLPRARTCATEQSAADIVDNFGCSPLPEDTPSADDVLDACGHEFSWQQVEALRRVLANVPISQCIASSKDRDDKARRLSHFRWRYLELNIRDSREPADYRRMPVINRCSYLLAMLKADAIAS